jgi:hypothetical protein
LTSAISHLILYPDQLPQVALLISEGNHAPVERAGLGDNAVDVSQHA